MKHVVVEQFGTPEVLKLAEIPSPTPLSDEVLVKVTYVGIGAIDAILRRGDLGENNVRPPFVPGLEVSGEVVAVGKEVTNIQKGQRVAGLLFFDLGGYAEVVRVKAERIVLLPNEVDLKDGASLINPTTALLTLQKLAPQAKESLIVHAPAGGLGGAVVSVAKQFYPQTKIIGVIRDADKKSYVTDLGADQVLMVEEFNKSIADGERYDMIFDPVGGDIRRTSIDSLKPFGRIVVAGNVTSDAPSNISSRTVWFNQLSVYGFNLGLFNSVLPELVHKAAQEIVASLKEGKLSLPSSKIFAFNEVQKAHKYLESGKLRGRILLQ